ncbi:hypothetical protein A2U01_0001511 [Trifolium medium]|uniref:Transposase (putative) gypsy type domain-containing protein n=1 Tax=Trifolium medium TaxID=97028 RepID=A0A392M165_9FABA|nr:hypothetical protein [Trifolium medium]
MYQYVFEKLGVIFPLNDFEACVMWHLRVTPSQLHPLAWTNLKAFQYWCEYAGGVPTIRLFLHIFQVITKVADFTAPQGVISLRQSKNKLFDVYHDSLKWPRNRFLLVDGAGSNDEEGFASGGLPECRDRFPTSWTRHNFENPSGFYIFKTEDELTIDELRIKEDRITLLDEMMSFSQIKARCEALVATLNDGDITVVRITIQLMGSDDSAISVKTREIGEIAA